MPFWSDSKAENFKAKLEHKMCIAKETPESNFDLSDCNLSEIPPGVFSMCRVFLKESLHLQNNHITNLRSGGSLKDLSQLLVLNLNSNNMNSLPEDISYLICLQELHLENNHLKKLPSAFEKLSNLRHLNLKGNRLLSFPMPVCHLHNLQFLNLDQNPKVKTLPKELCALVQLKNLSIDVGNLHYPPQDICLGGTESIMKFLCDEVGTEYSAAETPATSNQTCDEDNNSDSDKTSQASSDLSASYLEYQRAKEKRHQDILQMEEALKEDSIVQSMSAVDAALKREKLLKDIAQEQEKMESDIMLLQSKKEKEKQNLLAIITKVEDHSAKLIEQLMVVHDRTRNLDKMLTMLEQDRIENEEIFSIKQGELEQLRKKEILEAMTEMLRNEENQRIYELKRHSITEKLQNDENESSLKLRNILQERDIDQQILIKKLLEEVDYQKEAFEVLQLQKDVQHREIAQQIQLIEKELSGLTLAEIKKKDLKVNFEINVLAEHRTALAYLLAELLTAKEQREKQLKERLQEMEHQRAHEVEDFWLIQYQKLLDRKPKGIIDAELQIDSDLKKVLLDASATDFLSLFAAKGITFSQLLSMTATDLKKFGILDEAVCEIILEKAWEYYEMSEYDKLKKPDIEPYGYSNVPEPSAPSPDSSPECEVASRIINPSAPPISPETETKLWCQSECVICLDVQSSSVFLPCGHVCCCQNCSKAVELCPMCRTLIASKFVLTIS